MEFETAEDSVSKLVVDKVLSRKALASICQSSLCSRGLEDVFISTGLRVPFDVLRTDCPVAPDEWPLGRLIESFNIVAASC